MTVSRVATTLLLAAVGLLLAGCGDDPSTRTPDGDSTAPTTGAGGGTDVIVVTDDGGQAGGGPAEQPDPRTAEEKAAETRREMDRLGRELLASFESRVYSPVRNEGVTFAEGRVAVRTSGVEARYTFTFDASRPLDRRSIVTRADGEDGNRAVVPNGTARQIFEFVQLSLNGPYRFVVNYLPPNRVLLTPAKDGKHRVVTAQPHKQNVLVSYSVDEQDLVAIRGTRVRPQKEIVYFAWDPWRGRHLLRETTFHGSDAVVTHEYDEVDGAVLLHRTRIRKQGAGFDAVFTYDRLDRGEPEDPLVPNLPERDPPDDETDEDAPGSGTPPEDADSPK